MSRFDVLLRSISRSVSVGYNRLISADIFFFWCIALHCGFAWVNERMNERSTLIVSMNNHIYTGLVHVHVHVHVQVKLVHFLLAGVFKFCASQRFKFHAQTTAVCVSSPLLRQYASGCVT